MWRRDSCLRSAFAALLLLAAATAFATPVPRQTATAVATGNNASCDIGTYAAATLLLPYFEVDISSPSTMGVNTIFTVINTSRQPQMVRVTIWTDLGFPASFFNMFLSGYDTHTVSLFEVLARGNYPHTTSTMPRGTASADHRANPHFVADAMCETMGGTLSPEGLRRIQRVLTTGERDDANCRVGNQHRNAVGYVTLDVINSCSADPPTSDVYWNHVLLYDNVLTGDYERINPNPTTGNYAGGGPLVHIRAVPEGGPAGSIGDVPMPYTFYDRYTPRTNRKSDRRQPLPSTFAARFIQGGPGEFQTNFTIWREGVTGPTRDECVYAANKALNVAPRGIVRFDEHENAIALSATNPLQLPPASAIATSSALFPPLSAASGDVAGWFWLALDNGAGVEGGPYSIRRASQNWVTTQMYAEGRYAVDFDATWLANGCTVSPATQP